MYDNTRVTGGFVAVQPVVLKGKGIITFGGNIKMGVQNSPLFYNTYVYIEARTEQSQISFGKNTYINNSFSLV